MEVVLSAVQIIISYHDNLDPEIPKLTLLHLPLPDRYSYTF